MLEIENIYQKIKEVLGGDDQDYQKKVNIHKSIYFVGLAISPGCLLPNWENKKYFLPMEL